MELAAPAPAEASEPPPEEPPADEPKSVVNMLVFALGAGAAVALFAEVAAAAGVAAAVVVAALAGVAAGAAAGAAAGVAGLAGAGFGASLMMITFLTVGVAGAGVVVAGGVAVVAVCGKRADDNVGHASKEIIRKYRVALWDMSLTSLHDSTGRTL